MTRIFTDGGEMGDTLFWDTPSLSLLTSGQRSGDYCYRYAGASTYSTKYFSPLSELYFRMGFYHTNFNNEQRLLKFRYDSTVIITVRQNQTTFKLNIYSGDSNVLLGESTNIYTLSTWALFEIYLKIDDSPNGKAIVKMNGITEMDFTGDTKYSSGSIINNIYMNGGYFDAILRIDDLALNDTNGVEDNSWCDDGHVIKLTPSGSGTHNNWLNSGSVSGSANYLYVDDFPANTTDYVYTSPSSTGLQTQFALSDFNVPGANITRIFSEARVTKTSGTDYGIKLGQLALGGTDVVSGSRAIQGVETFVRIVGDEAKLNPVSGSAWTADDLNNLELVLEI